MDRREWLLELARGVDPRQVVTVPAGWLLEALEGAQDVAQGATLTADLTVGELAAHFGRSPSTVRSWLERGELAGYRLQGREWRVTREALEAFQQRERTRRKPSPAGAGAPSAPLSEWRKHTPTGGTT